MEHRRFDSISLFHVKGIAVQDTQPIEGHPGFSRYIRIHFGDGSYTTIDCHSDEPVVVKAELDV